MARTARCSSSSTPNPAIAPLRKFTSFTRTSSSLLGPTNLNQSFDRVVLVPIGHRRGVQRVMTRPRSFMAGREAEEGPESALGYAERGGATDSARCHRDRSARQLAIG